MLACRLIQRDLSSYLDGELPAARAARLEAHLRTCQRCREEIAALEGINDQIRAVSHDLQVSQDFDQRVLRAVGYYQVTRAQRQRKPLTKPLVVVALILLALLGMIRHFFSRTLPLPARAPVPAVSGLAPAASGAAMPDRDRDRR